VTVLLVPEIPDPGGYVASQLDQLAVAIARARSNSARTLYYDDATASLARLRLLLDSAGDAEIAAVATMIAANPALFSASAAHGAANLLDSFRVRGAAYIADWLLVDASGALVLAAGAALAAAPTALAVLALATASFVLVSALCRLRDYADCAPAIRRW
jgi:hypothetical protein